MGGAIGTAIVIFASTDTASTSRKRTRIDDSNERRIACDSKLAHGVGVLIGTSLVGEGVGVSPVGTPLNGVAKPSVFRLTRPKVPPNIV